MSRVSRYFFPEKSNRAKLPLPPGGFSSDYSVYDEPTKDQEVDLKLIQAHGIGRTRADAHRAHVRSKQSLEAALKLKRKRRPGKPIQKFWQRLKALFGFNA